MPFSIATVAETLTFLMNTPMIPPPEEEAGNMEVPLTEFPPPSSRRQQFTLSRASMDSTGTTTSSDASSRSSVEVVPAAAVLRAQEAIERIPPITSRIPATPYIPRTPISPRPVTVVPAMLEAAAYNNSHFGDAPSNDF